MTTFDIGRSAEAAAADFLKRRGCLILEQNWRTQFCEIDLVAKCNDTIYFCEVKYRRDTTHGAGLDYITSKKLRQMRFAAELWINSNAWSGDFELCAIEVTGPKPKVTGVVRDF